MARRALFSFCVDLFWSKKGHIEKVLRKNGRLEYTGGILELLSLWLFTFTVCLVLLQQEAAHWRCSSFPWNRVDLT